MQDFLWKLNYNIFLYIFTWKRSFYSNKIWKASYSEFLKERERRNRVGCAWKFCCAVSKSKQSTLTTIVVFFSCKITSKLHGNLFKRKAWITARYYSFVYTILSSSVQTKADAILWRRFCSTFVLQFQLVHNWNHL